MESSTALNSYTPLDLTTIPRPKIQSDKELESEIAKICEVLRDTCKLYNLKRELEQKC
jgi:hypothetical protein